jgi:hypothetical protein
MQNSSFAPSLKRTSRFRVIFSAVVALAFACAGGDSRATVPTGSLTNARYAHTAANLPDGRVLIAGGHRVSGSLSSMTTGAEIYDPATGTFAPTGSLVVARAEHATATLADGRILVVGGLGQVGGTAADLNNAETYDPVSGTWTATGTMSVGRRAPIALTLHDGRVLVVGGSAAIASSEIFDPATNSFTPTGSLGTARGNPAAALLADGRVLVAGGYPLTNSAWLSSAEIWDPATGVWSATGSMTAIRAYATATTLSNGHVLVAGGFDGNAFSAATELYDPATGTFAQTGALNVPREGHMAAILSDGNVVISGGTASTWIVEGSDEIYDVVSGLWHTAGSMSTARNHHTLSLLSSGNVLIAGGSPGPQAGAELFFPSCSTAVNSLTPTSQGFTSGGGSGSVALSVPVSCGWSITRLPSWMTVTSGTTGMGSTTVAYTVAPMTTMGGRGATPRIADIDFPVNQTGVCSPAATLSPTSQSFTASAGTGSTNVTYGAGCTWTVTGVPAWVTLTSSASGQGNGTVTYTIAANTGAARSATLTIGNTSFVVNQAAVAPVCDPAAVPSISPASASYSSSSASGSVTVTHGAGCAWSVSGAPAWITITAGASGQGNGTVAYSVAGNAGSARSATFTIATKSFSVSQAAPTSGCTTVPIASGVLASGALAGGDCTSGARGSSYYTDRYMFTGAPGQRISVQLSSSAFDTYVYLRDPSNTVIASNDDGGGGTNSRIPASSGSYTLPAGSSGTYVIEVTSYGAFATGAYTLTYTQY